LKFPQRSTTHKQAALQTYFRPVYVPLNNLKRNTHLWSFNRSMAGVNVLWLYDDLGFSHNAGE